MAQFPTDVDESLTIAAPPERVYAFLWDVVGPSGCLPDLATCERADPDTYRFVSKARSAGPVTMVARYTAHYEGNGVDRITFESVAAEDDNTEVRGTIALERAPGDKTRVRLMQTIAPETPVPRLLQGLLRSFVQGEAVAATRAFLGNVRRALEAA